MFSQVSVCPQGAGIFGPMSFPEAMDMGDEYSGVSTWVGVSTHPLPDIGKWVVRILLEYFLIVKYFYLKYKFENHGVLMPTSHRSVSFRYFDFI